MKLATAALIGLMAGHFATMGVLTAVEAHRVGERARAGEFVDFSTGE